MDKESILYYLNILNDELYNENIIGEIYIYGGAVLCLTLNDRESTEDIDSLFHSKISIMNIVARISREYGLNPDWFNNGVKDFVSHNNDMVDYLELSNLSIKTDSPEYLFAMKCLSYRIQNIHEMKDIKFLFNYLGLSSVKEALDVIYKYYDHTRFNQKLYYVLQEISDSLEKDFSEY